MSETETDESNIFDQFESFAEILAFIYSRHGGGPAMRELLDLNAAKDADKDKSELSFRREYLWNVADELESVGLKQAAAIVAEYAQQAPHELECCPYPENSHNAKAWYMSRWQKYGLCAYCGNDPHDGFVCTNGQTCVQRQHESLKTV